MDEIKRIEFQHESPNYLLYQKRLDTYKKWPKQMRQDKYSLAAAGLFL